MKLVTFRLQLAETVLKWTSKISNKRETINHRGNSRKKVKKACSKETSKDIRSDKIDHWSEHSINKQQCKMLNYKGFTKIPETIIYNNFSLLNAWYSHLA